MAKVNVKFLETVVEKGERYLVDSEGQLEENVANRLGTSVKILGKAEPKTPAPPKTKVIKEPGAKK